MFKHAATRIHSCRWKRCHQLSTCSSFAVAARHAGSFDVELNSSTLTKYVITLPQFVSDLLGSIVASSSVRIADYQSCNVVTLRQHNRMLEVHRQVRSLKPSTNTNNSIGDNWTKFLKRSKGRSGQFASFSITYFMTWMCFQGLHQMRKGLL